MPDIQTGPRFCAHCGGGLSPSIVEPDNRQRLVCDNCGAIAYQNPKILVACIATWQDKVLMMRRATEPQRGYWSIPSGFMECGETPEQACARELYEETRARVDVSALKLFLVGSLPEISEVYLVYRGELLAPEFQLTEEASEIALCSQQNYPRDAIAYPDVVEFIDYFYTEHARRDYNVYSARYTNGKNEIEKLAG